MKRYLIGYKSYLSYVQKYFVQRELQAINYSFITYVWSKVDVFFVTQCNLHFANISFNILSDKKMKLICSKL